MKLSIRMAMLFAFMLCCTVTMGQNDEEETLEGDVASVDGKSSGTDEVSKDGSCESGNCTTTDRKLDIIDYPAPFAVGSRPVAPDFSIAQKGIPYQKIGFPSSNMGFPYGNMGFPSSNMGFQYGNMGFPYGYGSGPYYPPYSGPGYGHGKDVYHGEPNFPGVGFQGYWPGFPYKS